MSWDLLTQGPGAAPGSPPLPTPSPGQRRQALKLDTCPPTHTGGLQPEGLAPGWAGGQGQVLGAGRARTSVRVEAGEARLIHQLRRPEQPRARDGWGPQETLSNVSISHL